VDRGEIPPRIRSDIDSIDTFARETVAVVDKYLALFADIHDVATAKKAARDIRDLGVELRALTTALRSTPVQSSVQEAEVALQLAKLPFRMNNQDISRVISDPLLVVRRFGIDS
jgi:hypothetical protein